MADGNNPHPPAKRRCWRAAMAVSAEEGAEEEMTTMSYAHDGSVQGVAGGHIDLAAATKAGQAIAVGQAAGPSDSNDKVGRKVRATSEARIRE